MEDDLRPEYDLRKLQMRKVGLRRKDFGGLTVFLEPDVTDIFFPDCESLQWEIYQQLPENFQWRF